jgi:2-phospho-L-lactate guanylyltransferase
VIWAVVPAKISDEAKVRLAPALPARERTLLVAAMLTDVLCALATTARFAGIAVVTRDDGARRIATERSALLVDEPAAGALNSAVAAGIAASVDAGATGILVAMADLPLLTAPEVERLLDRLPALGVAAAPSFDRTGTNLLAMRPPHLMTSSFGPNSLALHRSAAARRGLTFREVDLPGAALDIDTPADLARLIAAEGAAQPAALAWLRETGLIRLAGEAARR